MAKGLHPQVGTVRFAVHGMWVEWLGVCGAGSSSWKAEWQRSNERWMPSASPSLTVRGPALQGAEQCWIAH